MLPIRGLTYGVTPSEDNQTDRFSNDAPHDKVKLIEKEAVCLL